MGRMTGKIAIVTGGARGQGRSHALRLAEEGAHVVVTDIADQIANVKYPMATESDLQETAELVAKTGQRCIPIKADVRSGADMKMVAATAVEESVTSTCCARTRASPWSTPGTSRTSPCSTTPWTSTLRVRGSRAAP